MNDVFSAGVFGLALDIISGSMVLVGVFFITVGAFGVIRMPDVFTRMHAASVIETAGLGFILVGLIMQSGSFLLALKLLFILVLFLITSPVISHAIARTALLGGEEPLLGEVCCDNKSHTLAAPRETQLDLSKTGLD
ncbi:MAG: monovalent cation/H(+) antiporter subunit G [Hyphomicrobiaceae bacterium]|nr:monovalent cation/H(+) antiporter subunit G [Hyphomicrobiaceae bacterium]